MINWFILHTLIYNVPSVLTGFHYAKCMNVAGGTTRLDSAQFGSTRAQVLTKCQAYYLHIAYNMHNSATRIKWWRFCALFSYILSKYFRSHVFYGFWVSWLFHTSVNNALPDTVAKLHIKNIRELNNEHKKIIPIYKKKLYSRFVCG